MHSVKLIRLFRNQSLHENNLASFVYLHCCCLWHSVQKECLIAGYEKSVKADQRQEEREFLFLNIHALKIKSHFKEISDVHLIVIKLRIK